MSAAGGSESPVTAQPTTSDAAKLTRGHSCMLCQKRKVKCDGQRPCSTCVKHGENCVPKPPSAPRRRKLRDPASKQDPDVLARIKRLEEDLKTKAEDGSGSQSSIPTRANVDLAQDGLRCREAGGMGVGGQMINERGHSRYVENTLWAGLKDELSQVPKNIVPPLPADDDRPSAEGLLFGSTGVLNLTASHPQPVHIFQLWQKFLDNVNPLTKLFHSPTMQQAILDVAGHLESVPRSTEALLFAIYLSAVNSMKDEECQSIIGERKAVLMGRFSKATEFALSNAKFLRSYDIVVLQALTLFLLSMRQQYDPQSLWLLTGLAIRSAQRIGLHRDAASQGFSVFDAEMRRRLWWQIVILDSISAKLSGAAIHASPSQLSSDMKRPLNVNDSDLWPTMKETPKEHIGVTEMLFCSIRCEIGEFLHQSTRWSSSCLNGQLPRATAGKEPVEEKDKGINELEAHLEFKFLRFCDPSISVHLLATYMAKSAIAQMRLAAHHPYQYADKGASLPQEERDLLFSTAIDIIQYHNLSNSAKCVMGFLWHVNVIFPFEAFIYVLNELSHRSEGDMVGKARCQVHQAYENHPELINDTGNALYFAMGNLAVRAWSKGPGGTENYQGEYGRPAPLFIERLRSQRHGKMNAATKQQPNATTAQRSNQFKDDNLHQGNQQQWGNVSNGPDSTVFSGYMVTDQTNPMDWDYWQSLLDGRDIPVMDQNLQGTFSYI